MLRLLPCLAFFALVAVPLLGQAPAPQWGGIKGQVVFAGGAAPVQMAVAAAAALPGCQAKGPTLTEEYVVDPKTNGVKWVMVWLVDPANPKAALPVNPAAKAALPAKVSFDQPCCTFEPHVLGVVEGQVVEAKNSAPFAHNVNVLGGALNPNLNEVVAPGKSIDVKGWKASATPVSVSCTIHPWMKMWIRVFPHPHFAVTDDKGRWEIKDAPAGKWNLVVWHEAQGWGPGGKTGTPVVIEAGKVADAGVANVK